MAFYTAESDSTLQDNFIVKDADVFIMKIEAEGTGVESEATDVTLTPATSPAWTINAYQSTVGRNLVVTADSSKLFTGKVKSNSATAVVFDPTLMTLVSDGATAGSLADWAAGTSYSFRIYTASSVYAYGDYFGHCRDVEIAPSEDILEFKKGVPREAIVQDLLEFKVDVNGVNFTPNTDVFRAMYNGVSRGLNTSQTETHFGFSPAVRAYYKLVLVGQNRAGFEMRWEFFKGQFKINGNIALSAEEYKGVAWSYSVKKDNLRGDAHNAFSLVIDN